MPKSAKVHKFRKKPPSGFSKIEPTLDKFEDKLKTAADKPIDLSRPKHESTWEIQRLHHQRSRYVYDLYYKKKIISRQLYDWLLKNKFADAQLIAKWKKQGYENLCCLECIQTTDTNQGKTCICRVPKATLKGGGDDKEVECINCGCHGCASSD